MKSANADLCHNIRDPKSGELVHIPGCMGCAAMGHDRCTCGSKKPLLLIQRIERLERRVRRLEAKVRFQS